MDDVTELLREAGRGDREALAEFVAATQADVWRFCAAMLGRDDADEATQETFVRAWRSAPAFRGDASARTWLLGIARRVCFRVLGQRARADRQRDAAGDIERLRAGLSADQTEALALSSLLTQLDPDRRGAFVLTQVLGLAYDEAARVSGCPIGTIRSRVARARRDLRNLLGETGLGEGESQRAGDAD